MRGHEEPAFRPPKRDLLVQWRIFAGIAVFMAAIGTLYWFVSYEEAGTSMLALSSGLALLVGVFLWRHDRAVPATALASHEPEEYLPAASIWPFGIGVSAFLTFNGLILGLGYAVPGAILMTMSLAGFIRQSRARA
jgi:hypothetical protein